MNKLRQAINRITNPQPAAPPSKINGHGDHWGCIVRADEEPALRDLILRTTQAKQRETSGDLTAYHASSDYLGVTALVTGGCVVSAYPESLDGAVWPITISEVVSWSNGFEGQIRGECHNTSISFFDTRFYANRHIYQIGATYNFQISAFAYVVGRSKDAEFESNLGASVSLKGAHAYMPANVNNNNPAANIDDHWFHSPLEGAPHAAELAGKPLTVYPIIICIPEHFEMRVNLYAAPHAHRPDMVGIQTGDDLEGFLWLQGRLKIESSNFNL